MTYDEWKSTEPEPYRYGVDRDTQDLLAERRDNVQELRREKNVIARACIETHIDMLDAELARRRD